MINLHNHTTWSDGRFSPEEIVQTALAAGLTHVGISDHFRSAKLGASGYYVVIEEFDRYVAELRSLGAAYAGRIQVLVGIEIDFSERTPLAQLWRKGFQETPLNTLDYVLFEYVADRDWRGYPLSALISYRRWLHVPVGLAHSFLARNFAPTLPATELAQTLAEQRIFVELNTAEEYTAAVSPADEPVPYYRYPDPYNGAFFAACHEHEVLFSVGSDTHRYLEHVAMVEDAHDFLRAQNLAERLITRRLSDEIN